MNIQAKDLRDETLPPPGRSWRAQLDLHYEAKGDRTVVRRRHVGPLLIQRPFYPEADGTCHTYILHPPGGVAGGDSLNINLSVGEGARCLLTAPGATKVYRAPIVPSHHLTTITVASDAVCEWMPMDTIVYDDARARFEMQIALSGNATFFGWDMVSLGRPAARERFTSGLFTQKTTLTRDGTPLWLERAEIAGGSDILDAAHGFDGHPIFGTALYAGPLPEGVMDVLKARVAPPKTGLGTVSRVNDVIVCRYIGAKVGQGRGYFAEAWRVLRQMGQGKPASVPRIWAT